MAEEEKAPAPPPVPPAAPSAVPPKRSTFTTLSSVVLVLVGLIWLVAGLAGGGPFPWVLGGVFLAAGLLVAVLQVLPG